MSLRQVFEAYAPGGAAARGDLEARLEGLVAAGRAAWPSVPLDPAVFVRHLAERLPAAEDPAPVLTPERAADLYLACACAQGTPAALDAFERHVLPRVALALPRLGLSPTLAEEAQQALRVRLFVAEDGRPPRIAEYAGRGPLVRWVGVTLAHLALRLREQAVRRDDEPLSGVTLAASGPDPELDYLKTRAAADFGAAFRTALGLLSRRERNVLRLRFVEGLGLHEIALLYRTHRATIVRWIGRSQKVLLRQTRRALAARLQLDRDEAESLLGFVRSRIDTSLPSVLGDPRPPDRK